jgi:ethanolamine utilization protein EutA (predicted chaperonin)
LVKFTEEIAKKYLKLYKNSDDAALRAIVKGIQRALVQFDKKQSEKVALAITAKSRSRYKAVAPIKK